MHYLLRDDNVIKRYPKISFYLWDLYLRTVSLFQWSEEMYDLQQKQKELRHHSLGVPKIEYLILAVVLGEVNWDCY